MVDTHRSETFISKMKIIHGCFPDLIPHILDHMEAHCNYVMSNRDLFRKYWLVDPLLSFDWWMDCIQELLDLLRQQRRKLIRKRNFFALEIFDSPCTYAAGDFIFWVCPGLLNNERFDAKLRELFPENCY